MEQDDYMMNYGADPTEQNKGSGPDSNDPTVIQQDPTVLDPTVLDPTVIATKTRRPQVKLTSEKLLSDPGLPFVMKHAPKRIRISTSRKSAQRNLSNIVQFYQLWAHNLFPKAKFRDFIKLCETLGKTDKSLKEYRANLYREDMGIDPVGYTEEHDDNHNTSSATNNDTEHDTNSMPNRERSLFVNQDSISIPTESAISQDTPILSTNDIATTRTENNRKSDNDDLDDDDDDLYSISAISSKRIIINENHETEETNSSSTGSNFVPTENMPSQIELDEMMHEMTNIEQQNSGFNSTNKEKTAENQYSDDEEALNEIEKEYMNETMNDMGGYGF
ncbi:similar to Saccharomyces cerevisiae YMR048W CSM3 Replication fork associated factor, required for stable replication fork pausing [Maudiozyma barnettii]|uniref:Chromosome segregation in meiosis protein n=1 Tax=Maudiozyma barnettii TaxID=61262 RepID=A0A8H2ZIH7_9SACH|nr:Csm3p [Kazachstania barnettii]CAB4256929.1 similar to Saccharomyces cerevisiae YMR048W CSM3 Replication fork associated factor, required for stable replication fork pausing [Kazachstania barnettii]CAD1785534.1 similar to Saccharomyces cerevisiae YMR048W CSM3 Replication fork associated factor, required for stable replication fork pausing [Kazachstania barnettii]